MALLAACGAQGSGKSDSGKSAQEAAAAKASSAAHISIAQNGRPGGAGISTDAKVSVSDGTLTTVSVTDARTGQTVDGKISADGRTWSPEKMLARATTYKVSATAKDSRNRTTTAEGTFTTVSPANSFIGTFTPEDGSTVGVGMPVSIEFDKAITNKKDVESHIKVASTSGQQVVGHWFGDQRLDFRPQEYWKPDSTVTLKLDLDGVQGAGGITGIQNKTVTFTIGHSQVSTVDINTQTMTVVRDGKVIKTVKISGGSPDNPTYNGQMVISEKNEKLRMDGSTVGFTNTDGTPAYDIPDVPHAMRLSTSGTFIHGNYWAAKSVFGSTGTSHGCVALGDEQGGDSGTDGAWFFDNSQIGDVVIVKNSPDKTVQPDNGLNGWNMSWDAWKAGSALKA
ncbi:Ig-like domain-containing protein [Streptomyces sp. NPDC001262]|uniref:L,D-transpeptidase n=1 Tax=Streptomyces sp. NPDC001262 TaxID=3364552 RepID=UPI0036871E10